MLIQCEKCQNKYNLDESKIPGKGAKVTCPSCKNVFIVMKDGSVPPASAAPRQPLATPTNPSMSPPGSKSLLDSFFDDGKTIPGAPFPGAPGASPAAPGRGIKSWKVRVASGLVYDFTDPATLKNWIAEKKVTPADSISGDGASWTPIGSIGNLDAFFGVATPLGAPGAPPLTGFGPGPAGAPVAPAFAPPSGPSFTPPGAGAGPSLGDLFAAAPTNPGNPPPSGNPFQPSFNAAIPGSFAPPPPRAASNDPFAGLGNDPFGAAPAPAWSAGGAAPAANPFAVPDLKSQQPLPPPWTASAAAPPSGPSPAAPSAPASIGPPWGGAVGDAPVEPTTTRVTDAPPPQPPPKEPGEPKPRGRGRGLGRIVGLGLGGALVLAIIAGAVLHKDDLLRMLHPPPVVTPAAVTPVATGPLEGEAKAQYLRGRRYLRIDTVDAYGKAAAAFRAALAKAPNDPKAEAGVLEALSLEVQANGTVGKDVLDKAFADANGAFKDDFHGLETNRAIAQYYVATKQPDQAKPYLETALAAQAGDPESLYLRGAIERGDKATLEAAKADIAAAAKDPELTRAHKAHAELISPGTPEQRAAQASAAALVAANLKTESALDAGSWTADAAEEARLLPGSVATPAATEVAVATTGAPAATPTLAAATTSVAATPTLVAVATTAVAPTATPAPTQAAIATPKPTPTPAPTKTPKPTATPAPTKTPVAVKSAPAPTPTPVVKLTPEPTPTPVVKLTPPPTPAPTGATVASAGAEDHYIAGNAFLEAGSVGDAINEFDAAMKAAPSVPKYQLALAAAMMRGGRKADAAQLLADLTENEPRNAEAHRLLGLIFESTEQLAQACGEFDDYLRYAPTGRDASDIRARKLRDCGE